jgi:hypothetical protein
MVKEEKKIIKGFKVGGIKYKVSVVDRVVDSFAGQQLYGYHSTIESEIKLAKKVHDMVVSPDLMNVTLWHEVLHSMLVVMGYKFPTKDEEENFIDRLAYMLNEFEQTRK